MNYERLTEQVRAHVKSYFAGNEKEQLTFHDISHTEAVVAATNQIAGHCQLNEHDLFVVTAAAWFHDIGYFMRGTGMMHEQQSAGLASGFLFSAGVDNSTVNQVENCILATRMPQNPVTLPEQILCDADLFHLGTDEFSERNKQMRKEYEATHNVRVSKGEWREGAIRLMQSHQYHTEYCRELLSKKKEKNLQNLLKKQQNENPGPVEKGNEPNDYNETTDAPQPGPGKTKLEKPSRGIETMFRIAVTNHQRLSDMADKKANIMISVNSIIISVVIGLVMHKIETTHVLIIPTMLLLSGCVTAVVFAILATRPKIPGGYFTGEQLSDKSANLLFFGNFYKMDYQQYYEGMQQVMADSEFLYASLIRDIHSQGKVLGKKYKKLRLSYTVFMFTLVVTILGFGVTFFFMS